MPTVWGNWVSSDTASTWGYWNTVTVSTATTDTWQYWVADTGTSSTITYAPAAWREPAPETEEQRAARDEAARLANERHAREDAERLQAEATARELLNAHLTVRQRSQLKRAGHFDVLVGRRCYRISPRSVVRLIDPVGEHELERLCIHPTVEYPASDVMLTQKLMLETDEERFREVANITPIRRAA